MDRDRWRDRFRAQGAGLGDIGNLGDDDPASVPGGLSQRKTFQQGAYVLDGHVAILVGGRATNNRDIDLECWIEQPFLAFEIDDLNEVLRRRLVEFAGNLAGIDEGPEPGFGIRPGR